MYYSTWTAVTKYYKQQNTLNNRIFFSYSSRRLKSKIKVLAGLTYLEAALWLADGHLLCPHKASSLHMYSMSLLLIRLPSFWFRTLPLWLHLTLITSLEVITINTLTLGVRASHMALRGRQFSPIILSCPIKPK